MGVLHHALIIYFYRKIANVEPEILQSKVVGVKENLARCQQHFDARQGPLLVLSWSAFIAGCEASDYELQDWFSEWFALHAIRGPGSLGTKLHHVMLDVWTRRQRDEGETVSWLPFLEGIGFM